MLLGSATPITGKTAWFGEQLQRAVEMAVSVINERGGVLSQTVKIVVADDDCDAEQAARRQQAGCRRRCRRDHHACSGAAIPAAEVYEETGIVFISPAATNPRLTDRGLRHTFRTCGRDDLLGSMVGDRIAEEWPGADTAIVHDGRAYPRVSL